MYDNVQQPCIDEKDEYEKPGCPVLVNFGQDERQRTGKRHSPCLLHGKRQALAACSRLGSRASRVGRLFAHGLWQGVWSVRCFVDWGLFDDIHGGLVNWNVNG